MSRIDNRPYYDRFSTTYESRRNHGYHRFLDDLQAELVADYLKPRDSVLELGCGTGLLLERLRSRCRFLAGIDLSTGMLMRARERGHDVCGARVERLPFADASFDLLYSYKVLAHVEKIDVALAEFHRVLRPSGLAVLEFYNSQSLRALRKAIVVDTIDGRTREDQVFTRYDDLAGIRGLLVRAGFRVEAHRGLIVLTPFALVHRVPVLGAALRSAERIASRSPLSRFGGFLSLVGRKV